MRLSAVIGEGPLVVKLAGIAGGVGLYRRECEAAARAGFRVALVDTAGDRADDPAPGPVTWDLLGLEVRGALAALGNGPAILWGTSYGSLVALAAAARHPARVAGLLLCFPPVPEAQPKMFPFLHRWSETHTRPEVSVRGLMLLGFGVFAGWEGIVSPELRGALGELVRASREAATPSSTVREKLNLLWDESPGLPPPGLWPRTSLVAARWDRIAPFAGAKKLAARMTGSRLVAIERAGHGAAWSRPDDYHAIAAAELGRISRTAD